MTDAVLTINAGSSSIKFALYERAEPLRPQAALRGEIDGIEPDAGPCDHT